MATKYEKKLLHPGKGVLPTFTKDSKAVFHFRTIRPLGTSSELSASNLPEGSKVIDDSRTMGNGPFELLIGREFKMSVWEELVCSMKVGEVARFLCPYESVVEYPRVSKALRDVAQQKTPSTHTCGFASIRPTGHFDLDSLRQTSSPLVFELELLKVVQPGEYEKEHWAMSAEEKEDAIPKLKEEGNKLYKEGKISEAAEKYYEALSFLEELCIQEKPKSDPWNEIAARKVPFILNYSQCKLVLCEYAEVIRHTTNALEIDKDNVKALFRRGKAHSLYWNEREAREDLARVVQLDPALTKVVDKELESLSIRLREKEQADKKLFSGKLF